MSMDYRRFIEELDYILVEWDVYEVLESKDAMEKVLRLRMKVKDPPYTVPLDDED